MEEWQKHIRKINDSKQSYCGVPVFMEWVFNDIDHAVVTILSGGRLLPCPACSEAVIKLLKQT